MSDCGCGKISNNAKPLTLPSWIALRRKVSTELENQKSIETMNKQQVINKIITEKGYTSYLEIGVDNPDLCFNQIECKKKVGVDPYINEHLPHEWTAENKDDYIKNIEGGTFVQKTSDDYFAKLSKKTKFDFIFIDGLHLREQVAKDIENALKHLKKGGFIMLHDCLPNNELEQTENPKPRAGWMGTVWQAFADLRVSEDDLDLFTINTDCGLGCIIPDGSNKKWVDSEYPKIEWSWEYYITHKYELMNIIEVTDFVRTLEPNSNE